MFFNREKELGIIRRAVAEERARCGGVLVYGRRRCGKSTLVREAMRDFDGVFVEFECAETIFEENVRRLGALLAEALERPYLAGISDLLQLLEAADREGRKIVLFVDEYQYLRRGYGAGNLDSVFQIAIDQLSDRMRIILCGSYISVMRETIAESSPLHGRFSAVIYLKPFNYLEAAAFYPSLSVRDKAAYYAVFGGMPFILEQVDENVGLAENIKRLLLDPSSNAYIVLSETLLKEIFKIGAAESILARLQNGKARNGDLATALNTSSAAVSQELNRLIAMDIIQKQTPINRRDDRKKTFYKLSDNLLRFFYTFVYPNTSYLKRFGAEFVYSRYIEPVLSTFISLRFEDLVSEYFELVLRGTPTLKIDDIGTYWYDSPSEGTNGEYDIVLKKPHGYFFIEAKYLLSPMSASLVKEESEKIMNAPGIDVSGFGFASVSGFESSVDSSDMLLITGEDLYSPEGIKSAAKLKSFF